MPTTDLKKKPLVEAIFEIKWEVSAKNDPRVAIDPNFRILLGRFSEKVDTDYPFHTPLPLASLPDEVAPFKVQHQFRAQQNGWPLVQIGPGIITVNDTGGYTWADFEHRCESIVETFFSIYPKRDELRIQSTVLRYLDAVECDFDKETAFDFLRTKMRVNVDLPPELFNGGGVDSNPSMLSLYTAFPCKAPEGALSVGFATGQKAGRPAIIWETVMQSKSGETPDTPEKFSVWLREAHAVTDDWFFKLIEGELERRFSGDQ